jgi:hypothetical protein
MEDATEADLPKPKLGFPPLAKILVDPEDRKILSDVRASWDKFRGVHISGDLRQYCRVVGELKETVNKPIRFLSVSNRWISGRIVDQDGKAGTPQGQELIGQISAELGRALRELLDQPLLGASEHRRRIIRDIRQATTWLFAGAPPEVISYLKAKLEADGGETERDIIEAAGRSFAEAEDLKVLYNAIIKRVWAPRDRTAFPIHSARAICRVMELRKSGPDAMTRTDAETFVEQALINMEKCVKEQNFEQTFFQAVKLFLYLLRYREIDRTFLLYENEQDRQLFDRAIHCLETAQNSSKRMHDAKARKAADLMGEIQKYMFFEGSSDIIPVLNELAGSEN